MREPGVAVIEAAVVSAGPVFTSLLVVIAGLTAFWLWSLIDVLSWPRATWDAAGLSKARWVLRIVILGCVGSVLYLRAVRRTLRSAYAEIRWGSGDVGAPDVDQSTSGTA